MQIIDSTPEQDREAIALIVAEIEYYDRHPTTINELFIPQDALRRVVQLAIRNQASNP